MNSYSWDDVQTEGEGTETEPTPRDLRAQLNKLGEKLKERDAQIEKMSAQLRRESVGGILAGKLGLDPRVAELVPPEIEADEEAVKKWAEKFDGLFVKPDPEGAATTNAGNDGVSTEGDKPNLTPEQISAMQRLQSQETAAGSSTPDVESAQLEQLKALFTSANGSSDAFLDGLMNLKPTT